MATSDDLWVSFASSSGEPITELMASWVFQLGYPVIHATRTENKIHVKQSRFTYLKNEDNESGIVELP